MSKKNLIILLGLTAALGMAGCQNTKKDTAETELSAASDESAKADTDSTDIEDTDAAAEDADTGDMDDIDTDDADAEEMDDINTDAMDDADIEETTEETAALEPVTPSDYLLADTSEYVTLGDLKGLEVTRYTYEITDEMLKEQIQSELDMYAEEVEADRASAAGDIIYVDLTSTVSGGEAESESTYFSLGDEEYGAEFDEQLTGLSSGDTKEFSISFDDDTWIDEWAGQTVDFTVEVTSVCELSTPKYDSTFLEEYTDYTTKEEYEEALRESLTAEYEDLSYSDVIDALFEEAKAVCVFTGYPEDLYAASKEELLSIYLAFAGSENEEDVYSMFDITEEDIDAEVLSSVNRHILINAICVENSLDVTEEEYLSFVEDYAEYYGYDSAVQFEEDYSRETLVWSLYESKAADYLYEAAKITEVPYEETAV